MNLRTLILALAALATPLSAQECTSAVSDERQIRAEGKTELVGDVIVSCTGGSPTAATRPPCCGIPRRRPR